MDLGDQIDAMPLPNLFTPKARKMTAATPTPNKTQTSASTPVKTTPTSANTRNEPSRKIIRPHAPVVADAQMKLSTVGVEKKIDELVAEGARQTEALTNIATYMKEFLKITQGVEILTIIIGFLLCVHT